MDAGRASEIRTEGGLRESEGRLRFLDRLQTATARLSDADQILETTTRMVGEHLDLSVCAYADMDEDQDGFTIRGDWSAPGATSIVGHYSLADFGRLAVRNLGAGEPLIVNDNLRELAPEEAATFQNIGIAATICMPLVRDNQLTALMAIHDRVPRRWSESELALIEQVVERSWAHIERVRAASVLRASEENFRTLALAMPNHVWTARPDGSLDWLNERVYAYSGAARGSLEGASWTSIVHPDDLPRAAAAWGAALSTGENYEIEFRLRRDDGAWRCHLTRAVAIRGDFGEVTRWIGTNTDIQDQKEAAEALVDLNAHLERRVAERSNQLTEAEDALRQAQKMEAVGQLTGGIAHDFNNLLAGISGSLEMLQKRLGQGRTADLERYIVGAQGAAKRAASLTQRLLAFSRRQTLDPKPLNMNSLVRGMEELLGRSIGPSVALDANLAPDLWTTRVDRSQLENALLNLAINARDAMGPEGGRLQMVTTNTTLDARDITAADLPPGEYVSLSVADTGCGMTPDVAMRAFDPFFTTKPLGVGTGLGLSMIYGFARQSGGRVSIDTAPGRGTTVRIDLPRWRGAPDEDRAPTVGADGEAGRGETILVVEDEDVVRALIVEVLNDSGYGVLEAHDGASASAMLDSQHTVDLLITDVGLPGGMNGRQVADTARVARPGLKVLFITGYAESELASDGRLDVGMKILTKPFSTAGLALLVGDFLRDS